VFVSLAYTGSKPGKVRKGVPLESSAPYGNFTSCFFQFLKEHRSTTFNGWEARNPVQEFGHHLSFISLSKHGYGRVSRRKHVHPVWLLAVVAFSSTASKNAEGLGMGWMGLKLRRRQRRTDSADRVVWDQSGCLVDVNANTAYLCLLSL
jgi:hypothetical protein